VEKFREVTPPGPKVIGAHTLNFGPIFEFLLLKNCTGTPVPREVCVSKPLSGADKNLREQHFILAEIWSSKKVDFGLVRVHCSTFVVIGPKFTKFCRSNAGAIVLDKTCPIFDIS